ncbi:MAG: class I SAM-dependent rRNA methyltransferase [Alphaproteobacteria bacterium]
MPTLPAVRIDEHSVRRVRMGYPWIFRSEVINAKESDAIAPGAAVDFVRDKGDFVGRGFYNPKVQLVGRVMTQKSEENLERFFIYHRVESAFVYREKIFDKPFYRLIHAESDGLPGLIVDRFGDVVVCQVNTAGMEALWPHIESALKSLLRPKEIILRNDTAAREMEGLEKKLAGVLGTLQDPVVQITENGVKFAVDVMDGQKTGWFYDQRDNRAWVSHLTKSGSLLDVFCHTGGFGITAATLGAEAVTFIDSSSDALMTLEKNAALNGVERKCQVIEGAAFDMMEKLPHMGRKYEVVCVDPPAFVKSRKDLGAGMKGYQKLARLAEPLIERSGYLFFASCSSHVGVKDLIEVVAGGLAKSGRHFQLIKTAGAGPDHPVHPLLPETQYLKALTFRMLD